ncbi:uncharacterized protein [Littorina saxatilis]|uniref:Uncharacterized protein n=1 Tax=Littorina saxatilis TaxID=31220 RepID=A0AAN9G7U7_9CAEN
MILKLWLCTASFLGPIVVVNSACNNTPRDSGCHRNNNNYANDTTDHSTSAVNCSFAGNLCCYREGCFDDGMGHWNTSNDYASVEQYSGGCGDNSYSVLESRWVNFWTTSCIEYSYDGISPYTLDVFLAFRSGTHLSVKTNLVIFGNNSLQTAQFEIEKVTGKIQFRVRGGGGQADNSSHGLQLFYVKITEGRCEYQDKRLSSPQHPEVSDPSPCDLVTTTLPTTQHTTPSTTTPLTSPSKDASTSSQPPSTSRNSSFSSSSSSQQPAASTSSAFSSPLSSQQPAASTSSASSSSSSSQQPAASASSASSSPLSSQQPAASTSSASSSPLSSQQPAASTSSASSSPLSSQQPAASTSSASSSPLSSQQPAASTSSASSSPLSSQQPAASTSSASSSPLTSEQPTASTSSVSSSSQTPVTDGMTLGKSTEMTVGDRYSSSNVGVILGASVAIAVVVVVIVLIFYRKKAHARKRKGGKRNLVEILAPARALSPDDPYELAEGGASGKSRNPLTYDTNIGTGESSHQTHHQANGTLDDDYGCIGDTQHVATGVHGMNTAPAKPDPRDVYSVVNKPGKKTPTPVNSLAKMLGDKPVLPNPNDVYSVVNKKRQEA